MSDYISGNAYLRSMLERSLPPEFTEMFQEQERIIEEQKKRIVSLEKDLREHSQAAARYQYALKARSYILSDLERGKNNLSEAIDDLEQLIKMFEDLRD